MQLSYRGAHYDAHLPQVQSDGVETIGSYRGAPATRRHFLRPPGRHQSVEMTYRGVKYVQTL